VDVLAGGTSVPIFVENGAKTVGQGRDVVSAPGAGARHAVIILIGTGRGRGRGDGRAQLTGGANSNGRRVGPHHPWVYDGDLWPVRGRGGCLEAYIGAGLDQHPAGGGRSASRTTPARLHRLLAEPAHSGPGGPRVLRPDGRLPGRRDRRPDQTCSAPSGIAIGGGGRACRWPTASCPRSGPRRAAPRAAAGRTPRPRSRPVCLGPEAVAMGRGHPCRSPGCWPRGGPWPAPHEGGDPYGDPQAAHGPPPRRLRG